jgi:hypothetical protein
MELPLQLDHLGRVVWSGAGRIGNRNGQNNYRVIMFFQSREIFGAPLVHRGRPIRS